jgi:singapore isolate B (sub-type 7) whole genome shotgun sequence assembly, scaffold_24
LLHATPKAITHVDPSVIRQQLASLPAPQNEYEASLPEEELTMESDVTTVEDAEEIERQIREEEAALEREELARRSEVMKRDLPRGSMIASRFMVDVEGAERLLREEMNAIMRYEDYKYPTVDSSAKYTKEVSLDVLSREDRMAAEMMILEEAEDLKSAVAERTADQLEEEYGDVWENLQRDLAYDPEEKRVIHLKDVGEVRQKCENER